MKKITLMGGVVCMAISLTLLSSCKKEEINSKKAIGQHENQEVKKTEYKFSAVAKIPGETPENGYLSLKVSSNDEAFMKKYVAKLEQTKIVMQEVNSTEQDEKDVKPLFDENESKSSVGLDFNWDNFSFDREKGKIYQVTIKAEDQSKSLVYYTSYSNTSQFTSSWGYAAVNVYSTNATTFDASCFCWKSLANWKFSNAVNYFFNFNTTYHDNLEIRCFQNSIGNTYPTYSNFSYFTINGIVTYYRPRYNYTSPEMPSGYVDMNAITSAYGTDHDGPSGPPTANWTLYITG